MQLFIFNLFVPPLRIHPFLHHFNAGTEQENQQENGYGSGRPARRMIDSAFPRMYRNGSGEPLKMTEKGLIESGHTPEKDHDPDNDQIIDEDLVFFQQARKQQMRIEIIESDIEEVTDEKERSDRLFGNERRIYRPRIKYQGKHQEATPGGNVYKYLGSCFIQRR